jgi:chromosome segregation ATPase
VVEKGTDSLKRQYSQLQQSLKDQKEVSKTLKKTIKDMKTDYEEKFSVNYDMVTSLQERIQELEDWNQREDSAPPAQAVPAARSSGNVDIGICQTSSRRLL